MTPLHVTARLSIHDGKLEQFERLAADAIRLVRDNDSGTLQYDWFLNDDRTECVVRESYRDSNALLEHLTNVQQPLAAALEIADLAVEIYGTPSLELLAAAQSLEPSVYAPFQSL